MEMKYLEDLNAGLHELIMSSMAELIHTISANCSKEAPNKLSESGERKCLIRLMELEFRTSI
jgi:hypothetical protein